MPVALSQGSIIVCLLQCSFSDHMQYVFRPGPALGSRTQLNTPDKTFNHLSRRLTACRGNDRRPNRGRVDCVARATTAPLKDPVKVPTNAILMRKQEQVVMRTLEDSQLAVSIYPTFSYNTRGGGGVAQATREQGSDRLQLTFDPHTVSIPDVSYRTAKFLELPLPPFFRIVVHTRRLTGWLDQKTGQVQLDFIASFMFTASLFGWTFYAAPPLEVTTRLTTETAQGRQLGGKGARMDASGYARLVGVADVAKTGDLFMDKFLRLPANTFALMSSHFQL